MGRRENGLPWLVRLHGTHVLIAGATGAGKASLLWGLVRAMFPLMQAGLVRVLAVLHEREHGRTRPHRRRCLARPSGTRRIGTVGALQPDQPGKAIFSPAHRQRLRVRAMSKSRS